jgi:hypothetical protein
MIKINAMKKSFGIIILLFAFTTVQSQVLITLLLGDKLNAPGLEFGLETGVSWAGISNMESNNRLTAFNLGFYFDIKMKGQLYLYTGVMVKSKMGVDKLTTGDLEFLGTEQFEEEGEYRQSISYFLVPALAKYKFKNHFYLEAGPQFGLAHKSWVEFNVDNDQQTARIREFNIDNLRRFDAGISGGLGYRLMKGTGVTIGVKYYYGFLDVYKEKGGTNNHSLLAKVNIPIGAAE